MNILTKPRLLLLAIALAPWLPLRGADAQVYGRFDGGDGPFYGRVDGDMVSALNRAPWEGGRETGVLMDLGDLRVLPPSEPRTILGIAGAYASPDSNPPKTVRWFAKSASGAATDGDDVAVPPTQDALKVEVELVIVVGKVVKDATPEEARSAIFGYTTGTEIFGFVESYHRVMGEDPERVEKMLAPALKLGDNFAPFGPFIHKGADWRERTRTLIIEDSDGKAREVYRNSTKGLLYPPEKILSDLSRVMTLEPGDLVFSGTSKALVAFPGETVITEVEGLGRLTNKIIK